MATYELCGPCGEPIEPFTPEHPDATAFVELRAHLGDLLSWRHVSDGSVTCPVVSAHGYEPYYPGMDR